ncbi:hypothetical protein [Actinomadura violacea]|uniref:Uncharacterized protein n=1 Tax=Actinomadura violacea TaxID=2819934 RepID=A0ABS3S8U0_9ACTN|nr:hypothetical protein [Actinomadura violacea]MBO2464650.1 hypothetical protein [Actinomadura violacea]
MLSLQMNDAALDLLQGSAAAEPPGGLATGLQDRIRTGITRRGRILTWADSIANAAGAPGIFPDLTAWECADTSFHLEDSVDVAVDVTDGVPAISEDGQRMLLQQGVAFALEFARLVRALDPPAAVRCILGANETNATFRFHQIRPDERWHNPNLDRYLDDKLIVVDVQPAAPGQ